MKLFVVHLQAIYMYICKLTMINYPYGSCCTLLKYNANHYWTLPHRSSGSPSSSNCSDSEFVCQSNINIYITKLLSKLLLILRTIGQHVGRGEGTSENRLKHLCLYTRDLSGIIASKSRDIFQYNNKGKMRLYYNRTQGDNMLARCVKLPQPI